MSLNPLTGETAFTTIMKAADNKLVPVSIPSPGKPPSRQSPEALSKLSLLGASQSPHRGNRLHDVKASPKGVKASPRLNPLTGETAFTTYGIR